MFFCAKNKSRLNLRVFPGLMEITCDGGLHNCLFSVSLIHKFFSTLQVV